MNRIIPSPAVFDMDKLKWINAQHIKLLPGDELNRLVGDVLHSSEPGDDSKAPILGESGGKSAEQLVAVIAKITQEKV